MDFKVLFLVVLTLAWAYDMLLGAVNYRSMYNPIPANVADIYDAEKYKRWQAYHKENSMLGMVSNTVSFIIMAALVVCNGFAWAASLAGESVYARLLAVLALTIAAEAVTDCVFSYIDNMVIEQKYGFNRMTMKRFAIDFVKQLAVTVVVECGLVCLFACIHRALGPWTPLLFGGVLVLLVFGLIFLYPILSKGFNKFRPLEDGELKDRLTALLNRYGYQVKAIEVILASERTTKSNAYFSGFGKTKTIVLYDNLLNALTTDEIMAVFAHEMGHGLHKDTIKTNFTNALMFLTLAAALFLSVNWPEIYTDFGFAAVNYGFAFVILGSALMPLISTVFSLLTNHISRTAEYRADRQAVEEGLGEALIGALKKLADENFSNLAPSPLLVALKYSHPTLDARIDAIRKAQGEAKPAAD